MGTGDTTRALVPAAGAENHAAVRVLSVRAMVGNTRPPALPCGDATLHDAVRALSAILPLERLHDVPAELERALLNARIVQLDEVERACGGGRARDAAIESESKKFANGSSGPGVPRGRSGITPTTPEKTPEKLQGKTSCP